MVLAAEVETEPSEEIADQEFLRRLVAEIIPLVRESRDYKIIRSESLSKQDEDEKMPIGGNLEHQQRSGVAVISGLCDKLESMEAADLDLSSVDYLCLERVLSFLIRRGEDFHSELNRLWEIKAKYEK